MQSNRAVGVVLLLVLVVGALVAWQFAGAGEPLAQPDTNTGNPTESANPAESADADPAKTATAASADAAGLREAVAETDPDASNLPSIVGQVVGPDDRPVADAEILCVPGGGFRPGFNFDLDPNDVDPFDPQKMVERLRGQAKDRVAVRSDTEGRFRVRVEGTSRSVSLRVLARGHLVLDHTAPRPTDRDTDLGVLQLEAGAVIAGRVLDAAGSVVAGARVSRLLEIEKTLAAGMDITLPGMDAAEELRVGESCVTDEAGRFELAHIEAGAFELRARHPDHPTATRSGLSVKKGQTLTDILVTLARGAWIRGKVTGMPAGATGLRVMATRKPDADNAGGAGFLGMLGDPSDLLGEMGMAFSERQSDIASDGAFTLRGLEADRTYRLWVGQEGRGFAGTGISSQRVEAAAGSVGIELRYDPGVAVTFVVVDELTGEPIERLWVRDQLRGGGGFGDMMAFAPGNARQKPYPAGKVTVANLRPKKEQKLRLTIDSTGYARLQRDDIALPASGSLDLGTFQLAPRPVVEVTVLTEDGGRPVASALVRLRKREEGGGGNPFGRLAQMGRGSDPRSARTDTAGRCTLNALETDAGELEVTCRGYAPLVDGPIEAGAASERVVRLLVGGSAEVTVLGPDQEPVQDATVEHLVPGGDVDRRSTDANGLARFMHLTPGSHGFRVAGDQGATGLAAAFARRGGRNLETEQPWQDVDVIDRQVVQLSLEKAPTALLTGVVRENGMPLVGAKVAFVEGRPAEGPDAMAAGLMNSMMGQMGGKNRRQADTGDDGVFELSELPSGEHSLRVTHRDRAMPSTIEVTLRDGQNRFDVDLDMTTLRGLVVDSRGNPVAGAKVTARKKPQGGDPERAAARRMMAGMMQGMMPGAPVQKTDGNGAFELRGVAPDVPLEVSATAKGLSPTSVEATVGRGQTKAQVELRMGEAGKIEVTVAKPSMFGAVTGRFVGPEAESVEPVMQVLRRGKGTLVGLRPGTWEVTYRGMDSGGGENPKRTVEVLAGQTVTVDF